VKGPLKPRATDGEARLLRPEPRLDEDARGEFEGVLERRDPPPLVGLGVDHTGAARHLGQFLLRLGDARHRKGGLLLLDHVDFPGIARLGLFGVLGCLSLRACNARKEAEQGHREGTRRPTRNPHEKTLLSRS
jgi:hypothetical protein